ncbi:SusC/RagA family TonB-linked outer membrane protein [Hallella colorans]|uniref:SusC/RagA family TonB-linked outer membrane protein n=1 Tax=Hallella colorans TaxID=1703337 RepID=UPI0023F2878E|nr:TonB-dependent receptor [Hallella colorans]
MNTKRLILFVSFVFSMLSVMAQDKTITGEVRGETGETIVGATVRLKSDARMATITDVNGKFSIKAKEGDKLLFSYVGYKTTEMPAHDGMKVELRPSSTELNEYVVTAFGTGQKKVSIVGSVQTIRPRELKIPTPNLSAAFAGRIAGMIAVQRSGAPRSDGADFWIRGMSTTSPATSPLIILDGVQITADDLNALDPEVIAEFSVLKDATATALYGSRGANGVIIVTTKTGENQAKPSVSIRVEGYVNTPTRLPKFVDGPRFMELFNEAIANLPTGATPYSKEKIEGTRQGLDPYAFPNVRWYDELFRNHTFNQKVNMNISGGGKRLNYFMSVTVDHQTGMLKNVSQRYYGYNNQLDYWRYAFQNNIQMNLTKSTTIALRLNTQIGNSRGPNSNVGGIFNAVINSNPVDFPINYPATDYQNYVRWGSKNLGWMGAQNPMADAVNGYTNNFSSTVIANLQLDQDLSMLVHGLKLSALASFKNWSYTDTERMRDHNFFELRSYTKKPDGTYDLNLQPIGREQDTSLRSNGWSQGNRSVYFHVMLLWNQKFGEHELGAMLNYNQDELARNVTDRNLLGNLPYRKQGLAGRVTYGYANKYLFEANFGYNGSENFAKGNRFGFFPSVAVGYNVSEERFWTPLKSYISFFKLRASYGLVGNDQIGGTRFAYMSNIYMTGGPSYTTGINQDYSKSGPKYEQFENKGITWEVGQKLNLGFDMRLFDGLSLSADFFREYRKNVFQRRGVVPSYMGTLRTKLYGNLAEVSNKGVDMSLDYNKQVTRDLYVGFRGTFTYTKNKIEKWDEPAYQEYPRQAYVGASLQTIYGYEAERLFIDEADVKNSPSQKALSPNVSAGDIKYKDQPNVDGKCDGKIDGNDVVPLGYPKVPQMVYGFGGNVKFKKIDFGMFFQGVAQTSMLLNYFHPFGSFSNRNVLKFIDDDHWSPENKNPYAAYPRLTKDDMPNNTQASSYWLRDASFLKLKNVELGYSFKHVRVYLSAINVCTFSKFKLWDPEMGGGNGLAYPTQRTFNLGLQMNL